MLTPEHIEALEKQRHDITQRFISSKDSVLVLGARRVGKSLLAEEITTRTALTEHGINILHYTMSSRSANTAFTNIQKKINPACITAITCDSAKNDRCIHLNNDAVIRVMHHHKHYVDPVVIQRGCLVVMEESLGVETFDVCKRLYPSVRFLVVATPVLGGFFQDSIDKLVDEHQFREDKLGYPHPARVE